LNFSDFAEFDFLAIRIFNWRNSKMKKTLIAMAVLGAASGIAMAASNVTLYGKIDTGIGVAKVKHGDTKVMETTGWDSGSRWGLKGVEELGNGTSVGFVLEQGFNSDDGIEGENGLAFNRESLLYVQGAWGKLGVGRFGSLYSGLGSFNQLQGWAFGTSYKDQGSWTSWAKAFSRTNNSIAYTTPSFGGFAVTAMYSNGTSTDDAKWSDNQHYYGIAGTYKSAALNATLGFEAKDGKGTGGKMTEMAYINKYTGLLGLGSLVTDDMAKELGLDTTTKYEFKDFKTAYSINAGGSYNFGMATVMAAYQYAWQDEVYKQHAFGVGVAAPVAGGKASFGIRYLIGKVDGAVGSALKELDTNKYRAINVDAGYTYPLSKRTYLYSFAGYTDGAKLYNDLENGKFNGWSVAAGMVHNF